ncbi:hypothetical protein A2690_03485 [Candidatus Roizmanbacteria bacterium RIFCSPHIGHO2_01_FULL_39_12b]|uniref:AAA+ ATPase domain-containing protein n=1 Tax=Candidatus Roizmanbacteria bacterium RIFCSPHIGHO2_01_FULL_39_12b TaxID=1802030 RepID=A0A1F7GDE6_9BACT|nr:MAG: hypothetical protein A2690_03485 [Candidatus Roizmanbacteria bacterium RIFCSPHIGHO2_01_FULL_39_12b]OGK47337.1 MAG: hypothetical protein A3B46_02270 [Candidatus Roizmanbacteria bacterium RIFCSPLOWO2_01_FULL_39_19]
MNYTPLKTSVSPPNQESGFVEIEKLREKISSSNIPSDLKVRINTNIDRIESVLKYGGNAVQIDTLARYVDWIVQLPWNRRTEDILDIAKAKKILDKNHFGLSLVKQRVLEYLSVLKLQKKQFGKNIAHAPILLFVGLAGTGKTTFAMSVAQSLGRQFIRIPFGGLSTGLDLKGFSKMNPEAEPGIIIRNLVGVASANPVILLDEIDRVGEESRGEIMGILLELLDPEQNNKFLDHFIDYPFDLSQAIFIATSNNTQSISTAVLDRLEIIQMPSYSDDDKIAISKKYILPRLLKESGMENNVIIVDDVVWHHLARVSGYDPGIRSIERKVESIVRRVALQIVENKGSHFTITEYNVREFVDLQ